MAVGLYITFEPEYGDPITLAHIRDRALLLNAADKALQDAQDLVGQAAATDALLGQLQQDEANRLRRALELVLPELRVAEAVQ